MGYGLDTNKYKPRKWGTTITWSGEPKGQLARGLAIWQESVGVSFSKTEGDQPDFRVAWGGRCSWSNSSKGNGRPDADKKPGTLNLKESSSLGTVLHEIGHLLGLSHEQDHPDHRVAWYEANPGFLGTQTELGGAIIRAADNAVFGPYDAGSIMHYPSSHYGLMTAPSVGDVAAVKAINGYA
jgi:hypothetical protein